MSTLDAWLFIAATAGVLLIFWHLMCFTADQFAAWWNGRGER